MKDKSAANFIIFTSHRSGSTWVIDVLNNLEDSNAFSELFLPPSQKIAQNRPTFTLMEETQRYLEKSIRAYPHYHYAPAKKGRIRPFTVFNYLNEFYAQPGAVGFKLMYGQLAPFPEIWAYVMARQIAVVHLIRQNYLDIIISHEVRKQTKIAHSLIDEQENIPPVQIDLEPKATLKKMRALKRNVQYARRLLRWTGVRHLEVNYEALKADPANFNSIFKFLNVNKDGLPPQSMMAKLVRADYPALIRDYVGLQQVLAESEFADLLTERR